MSTAGQQGASHDHLDAADKNYIILLFHTVHDFRKKYSNKHDWTCPDVTHLYCACYVYAKCMQVRCIYQACCIHVHVYNMHTVCS